MKFDMNIFDLKVACKILTIIKSKMLFHVLKIIFIFIHTALTLEERIQHRSKTDEVKTGNKATMDKVYDC